MSARDELAEVLWDHFELSVHDAADAILAAGYRKPRTITTVEELDALAVGAIILDDDPDALLKLASGRWRSLIDPSDSFQSVMLSLPATVLYEPTP